MEQKPKSHFVFGWKVITYLFLAGVGGGASSVGAAFHLFRPEAETVIKAGVMLGGPLVLIGCFLLFFDLGRPWVAYRAFLRPNKAWISRGTFVLVFFVLFGAIQFVSWIWPFQGLEDYPSLHLTLNVLNGLLGILTVIYTGFLFDTTRSIPFWSTPILPLLFLVSGLSTGILALILLLFLSGTSNPDTVHLLIRADLFLLAFEGLILFFYLHGMHEVNAARTSVRRVLRGDLAPSFWIGVILVGILIPLGLEGFLGDDGLAIMIACLFGLAGGVFVRFVVVQGAVKAPLNAEGVLIHLAPRPE